MMLWNVELFSVSDPLITLNSLPQINLQENKNDTREEIILKGLFVNCEKR